MEDNVIRGFVESVERHAQRPALFVEGRAYSYQQLAEVAGRIAATIREFGPDANGLAAVFAQRSLAAYAGVLGVLLSGRGYVPLNPRFPIGRTARMLEQSTCEVVVVGAECLPKLEALLAPMPRKLTLILPDAADLGELPARFPGHHFVPSDRLAEAPRTLTVPPAASPIAYLLFTSGSTGDPKGVPVGHRNVRPYLATIAHRFDVRPEDRASQTFDLTFDLSVHDLFVTWERGACLYCVPEALVSAPARFIRDHELTLWFSVPSVISFLSRLRLLRPGLFPSLRWSLFCGEALPEQAASAWAAAACHSTIENLYGPTEATIAITSYRWHPDVSPARCRNGIVPIGWPFPDQKTCIVDEALNPVPVGEPGELLLSGSQVTAGYWRSPEKTAERYVRLADGRTWYRTGDRAVEEADGCLIYLGRLDDQVKIRGYRAELQEIDAVLRTASGAEQVATVAWPVQDGSAEGVVGFVCGGASQDAAAILEQCRRFLPEHMVPRTLHFLPELPRNPNGKIDRRQLAERLDHPGSLG